MRGRFLAGSTTLLGLLLPAAALAYIPFGPVEEIQVDGWDIIVSGYSIPEAADWNNDGLLDILVGEGSGSYPGQVRIYLNQGEIGAPLFGEHEFLQVDGEVFAEPGG